VFDSIVFGEREPNQWMAGSNGFVRTQSFQGPAESANSEERVHVAVRYSDDGTIQAFRNGIPYGVPYQTSLQRFGSGKSQWVFGLRHTPAGDNKYFRGVLLSAACFEGALSDESIAALANAKHSAEELQVVWLQMSEDERRERQELRHQLQRADAQIATLRATAKRKIYTVISQSDPGATSILLRGDVFQEGRTVRAGGITGLAKGQRDFGLEDAASDAVRRQALAEWVTAANRPLLARVLVNRLWHYHFGVGIVDSPNDFGFNGGRPTHPELLDHLASTFLQQGLRIKDLQRRIVLSSTYQSSSRPNPDGLRIDPSNRSLWRYPLRRLDGESARDAMLKISGTLRREMGGPSYQDVVVREINGTTYFVPKETEGTDCFRRTVYRFSPRCERSALLDALDCPDPSAAAPRRFHTTTPLQALSLLNNAFVFQMSDALVISVGRQVPNERPIEHETLVRLMFREVLLRDPTHEEQEAARELVRSHGPSALARALWNSNEFLVLD
jgi:hypothetical protein